MVEHPFIYEINTWVWLDELSRRDGPRSISRASRRPSGTRSRQLGFDAVWLMGVWERSPAGDRDRARERGPDRRPSARALPDFATEDVVGSPYCIGDYAVDPHLGGPDGPGGAHGGAGRARAGADPRLRAEPRRPGSPVDVRRIPSTSCAAARTTSSATRPRSCGWATASSPTVATPTSRAWPDVVQLNAFSPDLRGAVVETLSSIAEQCDGVRCDMAMLMTERRLRAHLGRARRPAARGRVLAARDRGRASARTPTSSSSPRPTGTSSGRCSSRASTTATTSGSTTGSCTTAPSRCAGT